MEDIIDRLLREASEFTEKRIANIVKNADRIREFDAIGEIFTKALPTCDVLASSHEFHPVISISLNEGVDLMDVVEVIHDNAERLNTFGMSDEYTHTIDGTSSTVDFVWNAMAIYVYVTMGNCKLVVESTEMVAKHTYKLECL